MSIESDLFSALSPLCGGRVFPDVAPWGTETPYIMWQQIGGAPVAFTDATVADHVQADMQISVWAASRIEANALCRLVETTLRASGAFLARPNTELTAIHDDGTDRYGAQQDFSIWYAR